MANIETIAREQDHGAAQETERVAAEPLTVLSFGGGQDSTAILIRLALDPEFRARYAPGRLLAAMSDTGNEHPETYSHIEWARGFCESHGIEFRFITAADGYHSQAWRDLKSAYRRYSSCGSKSGYVKT